MLNPRPQSLNLSSFPLLTLVVGLVYIMHLDVGLKLWYQGVNKCRWPTANFFIGHFITREEIQLSLLLLPLSATVCFCFHFGHCFYGPNKRQTKLKSINKSWRLRPGIVSAIQLADGRLWANWFRSQLLWYYVSSSSSFRLLSQLCGVFVLVLVRENRKNSVTVEAATDNRPHEMYSPKDGGHDPRVWIHFSNSNANLKQLKDTGGRT